MNEQEKNYWVCIIGATDRKNLKSGADSPMRNAVEQAFEKTTGEEHKICWSGWGSTQPKIDVLNAIWSMDKNDPLYKIITDLLKENGRLE
jgi:hypothetical protein